MQYKQKSRHFNNAFLKLPYYFFYLYENMLLAGQLALIFLIMKYLQLFWIKNMRFIFTWINENKST